MDILTEGSYERVASSRARTLSCHHRGCLPGRAADSLAIRLRAYTMGSPEVAGKGADGRHAHRMPTSAAISLICRLRSRRSSLASSIRIIRRWLLGDDPVTVTKRCLKREVDKWISRAISSKEISWLKLFRMKLIAAHIRTSLHRSMERSGNDSFIYHSKAAT